MAKQEFIQVLLHLTENPQDVVFFEDDLKEYSLNNQTQDLFYGKYWNLVRFISTCYDVAEAQGLFAQTGCVYDELQREREL